ncbi:MAG: iron ABC transporter permease [Thermoproteales archaeon]|nr:iron ABC transporter permease [Thermoproteales archaeon]
MKVSPENYSKKIVLFRYVVEVLLLMGVVCMVLLPSLYPFTFILLKWNEIYVEIFNNPLIGSAYWNEIQRSLFLSFRTAFLAVVIDLLIGIPVAFLIARGSIRGRSLIEEISTLPLVIPTSGFGFAMLAAWTASESLPAKLGIRIEMGSMLPFFNVPILVLLVHVALTFPYVVKTVTAALEDMQRSYEIVSESLGASSLTTFRKIVLPLIAPAVTSGGVLAFIRSLGETGATMVVAGVSTTAPIAIVKWVSENRIAPAAFLSGILVALALLLIVPIEYFSTRKRKGELRLFAKTMDELLIKIEKNMGKRASILRDLSSLFLLTLIVVLPLATLFYNVFVYWSADPYTGRYEESILYQLFGPSAYFNSILKAVLNSFVVALISTLVSLYLGSLLVIFIVKSPYGAILRTFLKIPLVVPTSSLGLSMILLWGSFGLNVVKPSIWLIILTHIVFSVPVIVETGLASYKSIGVEIYEDTARTLGATPYDVAESISLPLIKRGLIAGSILAFTHSLGETGATFLVMGEDFTVSTLVVSMVESLAIPAALFASALLILLSIILVVLIHMLEK